MNISTRDNTPIRVHPKITMHLDDRSTGPEVFISCSRTAASDRNNNSFTEYLYSDDEIALFLELARDDSVSHCDEDHYEVANKAVCRDSSNCDSFSFHDLYDDESSSFSILKEGDSLNLDRTLQLLERARILRKEKQVRFSSVTVREYSVTVGSHLHPEQECPITLSWEHVTDDSLMDLSAYEFYRGLQQTTPKDFHLTVDERRRRIAAVQGITVDEVLELEIHRFEEAIILRKAQSFAGKHKVQLRHHSSSLPCTDCQQQEFKK